MRFLLTGNPNVGKSTFFNLLTKSNVKVANYTGITVESSSKKIKGYDESLLIDLPGTYSVLPDSEDEGIVTKALCHDHYNGIVNIVDSTHLKRNLHLSIQLMELGLPTLLVANMIDELKRSGYELDEKKLSELLNVVIISMSALKASSDDADTVAQILKNMKPRSGLLIDYGETVENAISDIKTLLRFETLHVKKRWLATQILEGNDSIFEYIDLVKKQDILSIVHETEKKLVDNNEALSLKGAIYYKRKEFISRTLDKCLTQIHELNHLKSTNKLLDKYLTHPIFGTLIFFAVMIMVYHISFGSGFLGVGSFLTGVFEVVYDQFLVLASAGLNAIGLKSGEFVNQLLIGGALTGVGGVLVFLPQIVVLFILLSIIEGTGYMSRVAISMDSVLAKFGMNGKSIVPMVTGFGCTVPAIMATRTISNKKERFLTILTLPFISCAARLPVYGFFVSIFFEKNQALIIFFIYILGVMIALLSGKLFSLSIFSDADSNFAIELPPYRIPHFKNVLLQAFDKAKGFIKKAGTYILIGSIAIWFLMAVGPQGVTEIAEESYLAHISNFFSPIFKPLGFGTWQATSAIFTGILAKEAVVSSLTVIYGTKEMVMAAFTSVTAFTFVIFISLYTPCIATIGTIRAETNSRKWMLFSIIYPFVVAYGVAMLIKVILVKF